MLDGQNETLGRYEGIPIECNLAVAFAASVVLYSVFGDALSVYEKAHDIQHGQAGSEASAMVFGEFYPNPESVYVYYFDACLIPKDWYRT